MAFQGIVHDALWKELDRGAHDEVRAAMKTIVALDDPAQSSNVKLLENCAFRKSYRLRVGRLRVLFIIFPDEGVVVFTTAFEKKRESDYIGAIERHERRVRSYE